MTIAVIGAGVIGLATLKNLREEGLEATLYEKASSIGGVWVFNPDPNVTSVLETTVSNVSRFKSCFTDFPASDELPDFLTAPQVCQYLKSYADNFNLLRYIVFDTEVESVVRNGDDSKWRLNLVKSTGREMAEFDKVVFCTGAHQKPHTPSFEGSESFKGKLIHSQSFKKPQEFEGMKVLVVGLGNTAADTSTSLVGHAEKVYVAHRRGAQIFPRHCLGKPIDLNIQRRSEHLKHLLTAYAPDTAARLHNEFVIGITKDSFGEMKPEWNIHPPPSIQTHQPVITENFVDCLKDGSIISCSGLRRFSGQNEVELLDDTRLEVDAVIFCTGYEANFSIMLDLDPTRSSTSMYKDQKSNINSGPIARLYQNIFDPRYPESIAYFCYFAFTTAVIPIADLMSMALAQMWKGAYKFPSEAEINEEIDKHNAWIAKLAEKDTVYADIVQEGPWQEFLHDAAGTGRDEYLGYGLKGWLYWLNNPLWCNMLMVGVDSPHSWRLFDGKRKKWDGAKEAILQANENSKKFIVSNAKGGKDKLS